MKAFLEETNDKRLRFHEADLGLLREHFGIEETVLAGGYGYRQVLALVQNGADALLEAHIASGDRHTAQHAQIRGTPQGDEAAASRS